MDLDFAPIPLLGGLDDIAGIDGRKDPNLIA
jgi:hypothetical protein